ncbi:unnamed protein product [Mortierella alpina]
MQSHQSRCGDARVWLNFFEAANAPTPPAPGRRTQAVRNAVSKQRAAVAFNSSVSANGPSAGADSTTPDYSLRRQSRQDDITDNSTNRPRIDSINLSSARLSPTFMANSPGESMPSTPTPLHSSRNARSRQHEDIAPPARIRWSQDQEGEQNNDSSALNQSMGTSTPIRSRYQYNKDALERASTTPTITLRDRPMSLSHYTQAASAAKSPAKTSQGRYRSQQAIERERNSVDGGFLQLDVEENHQDVITPPSTLHFSIPESKLAGTPRSVVAKSLVDKIRMKDGLVIPQPIFVNDDEDEDVATLERYTGRTESAAEGTSAEEAGGIGGSKKRSRDGDLLDADIDSGRDGGRSRSWASLTDQQRNRERLLKSPRKMASVQDFFDASPPAPPAPPNLSALAPSQEAAPEEGDGEDGSQSPSRQLMSQIQTQAESFEEDPLLAALATPPEVRKTIREHKARFSVVQRPVSAPTALSASAARSSSTVSTSASTAPISTATTTTTEEQRSADRTRDSALSSMAMNATVRASTSVSGSTSHHIALLTTAPVGTTAVDTPALRPARSDIDTLFKESFSSGFASSSRRQTMATPVDLMRTPQNSNLLNSNRGAGGNSRNSVGSGVRSSIGAGFSSLLTPKPFGAGTRTGAPGSTASSRLSALGTSAFRKPLHPASPSPASRAAANAIASATAAAQDVLSQKSGVSTLGHQQSMAPTSQSNRSNGLTRLTQPAGMGRFSIGGGYGSASSGGRASATPIVSTANFLAQAQDAQQATTHRNSVNRASQEGPGSDVSSRGSHTPFSIREPPPAPRLGYHSDTMMTQSSLGLNHDGFGGYDSEDRTRMTMTSGGGETGNAAVPSHGGSLAAAAAASSSNATRSAGRRMEDEAGYGGDESDDDDDDDDDDVTGSIMKSPCPPGRTGSIPFLGSRTDLKSVAQAATARPAGGRASVLGGSAASTVAGSSGGAVRNLYSLLEDQAVDRMRSHRTLLATSYDYLLSGRLASATQQHQLLSIFSPLCHPLFSSSGSLYLSVLDLRLLKPEGKATAGTTETSIHQTPTTATEAVNVGYAGSSIKVVAETRNEAAIDLTRTCSNIFTNNVNKPSRRIELPKPGARIETTPQLALCSKLLNSVLCLHSEAGLEKDSNQSKDAASQEIPKDGAQREWAKRITENPVAQYHIRWLQQRMVEEFAKDAVKGSAAIAEVVVLGPVLEGEQYRSLLSCFINKFDQFGILDVDLLHGLVLLVQCACEGCLLDGDQVKIMSIFRKHLQDTHQQSSDHPYHLTLALSHVLDAMAEHEVKDVDRVEQHVPLGKVLQSLQGSSDPFLMY